MVEQERQRVDEDLRRLATVAAYLRALLPSGHGRGKAAPARVEGAARRSTDAARGPTSGEHLGKASKKRGRSP
jgi:hypothetical protein